MTQKLIWLGGASRVLHYPHPDQPAYTACKQLNSRPSDALPSGKYTTCTSCREALGM